VYGIIVQDDPDNYAIFRASNWAPTWFTGGVLQSQNGDLGELWKFRVEGGAVSWPA